MPNCARRDNTKALVGQLGGDTKLIVTTIQKLNTAISRDRYEDTLQDVKDQRVIFIFDECQTRRAGEESGMPVVKLCASSSRLRALGGGNRLAGTRLDRGTLWPRSPEAF